jgi:hypothetical protein
MVALPRGEPLPNELLARYGGDLRGQTRRTKATVTMKVARLPPPLKGLKVVKVAPMLSKGVGP